MAASLGSLGWVALRQGDLPRLRTTLAESLALRLETGDRGGVAWCLEKLAEAAALPLWQRPARGAPDQPAPAPADLRRAARIYAAAAALRAPVGSVVDPADQPE